MIKRALTVGGSGGGPSNPSPFDDDDFGGPGDVAPSDMNFSTSKMVSRFDLEKRHSLSISYQICVAGRTSIFCKFV